MPTFRYKAINANEEPVEATIEQTSAHRVVAVLQEEGFHINSVEELGVRPTVPRLTAKLTWADVALFNEQLLAITKSGLPLVPSLRAAAQDLRRGRLKTAIESVRTCLETGATLEEAVAQHRHSFPAVYASVIRAGERAGNLPGVLARMAHYSARMIETRHKLQEALAYPALVLIAASAVFTFLLIKVVPVYSAIYAEFGKPIPRVTSFWLALARFGEAHALALSAAPLLLVAALAGLNLLAKRSDGAARTRDWGLLHVPVLGAMFAAAARGRFSHTLAVLLSSRVPVQDGLELAGAASGNALLDQAARRAAHYVAAGDTIADALSKSAAFPHTFCWMVATAEERGDLEDVLLELAESCEREVARKDATLTFLTGPMLIAVLGGLILFMLVSVYYPVVGIGAL
ncbi:MAG TPA: type II secretion system F family protein [Candidatus Hydrogenedentes bacterium]|nr:type II secretion system F family protein [Candidatus Hydrogenedentota bacterium]HIJ74253.1 type II secretion system F family protein [Candidatus Hydrogenedentota bacterium]